MDIILIKDFTNLGKKGEVRKVADGYARNFLFPNRIAVPANDSNMKTLNETKKHELSIETKEKDVAEKLQKKLDGKKIEIHVKSGENGKLYGAVTNKNISEEIHSILGIEIDRKKIMLSEPIKNTGRHNVNIHLHEGINAQLTVDITGIE